MPPMCNSQVAFLLEVIQHWRTRDFVEEAEPVRGMEPREADGGRGGAALFGGDFLAPAEPQLSPFSSSVHQRNTKHQQPPPTTRISLAMLVCSSLASCAPAPD